MIFFVKYASGINSGMNCDGYELVMHKDVLQPKQKNIDLFVMLFSGSITKVSNDVWFFQLCVNDNKGGIWSEGSASVTKSERLTCERIHQEFFIGSVLHLV